MLTLIIIGLFVAVLILPMRHAFGVNLAATFLFIVPGGIDVTSYLFLALAARLIVIKILTRQKVKYDEFIVLYLFLLFFTIISYLFFQSVAGLEYLRRFFMTIIIIFLFVNIYNTIKDLKLFIKYFLVGVLLLSAHLATQTIIPINPFADAAFSSKVGRLLPRGFVNQYVNPNNMGALLVWGFGLVVGFYSLFLTKYFSKYYKPYKLKLLVLSIILFAIVGILNGMLGSRASSVVLLISALLIFFKINLAKNSVRKIFLGFVFVYFMGPMLLISLNQVARLSPNNVFAPLVNRIINSESEIEGADYSRSTLALNGFKLFLDNPILGVGIGNEANRMKAAYNVDKVSHNTYISILSEMGLIGVIFLIAIVIIWLPYIKYEFGFSVLIMIGAYATFHNITLMSLPWLMMSFTKKCYDLLLINRLKI